MEKKHKIRIRNGFSDRNSIKPISKSIQLNNFDSDTKIVLYNSLKNIIYHQIKTLNIDEDNLCKYITEELFNEIYYNNYKNKFSTLMNDLIDVFNDSSFDDILTIIEFMCNAVYEDPSHFNEIQYRLPYTIASKIKYYDTFEEMNQIFEEECIGYRFVDKKIVKITNDEEIISIEKATSTPYDSINESITKSIRFISETSNKDYKNCIKEAITAVEQLFNILLNTCELSLRNALNQLCNKIKINEHLKSAIASLYIYTCDENGIRHGNNKENGEISFEEAKFVLLICSGIVNFFCQLYVNKDE